MTSTQIKWAGFAVMLAIGSIGYFMGPLGYILWMPVWFILALVLLSACDYIDDTFKKDERPSYDLKMASWDGDGRNVYCDLCGDSVTDDNLSSTDDDGRAYCNLH